MNAARLGHAACVIGGKIYVIGGKDEKGNYVSTIECFDPQNDSWIVVVTDALCNYSVKIDFLVAPAIRDWSRHRPCCFHKLKSNSSR